MKPLETLKKHFMIQVWRIQQSQMIISIVFWALTLTGIFYPYVDWRLKIAFGIGTATEGMILLFLLVITAILSFGFMYDRIFRLWKQQHTVAQERNPYARDKMTPKEILYWSLFYVPTMEAEIRLLELQDAEPAVIDRMKKSRKILDNLVAWNMENDSEARQIVEQTIEAMKRYAPGEGAGTPEEV